MCEQYLPTICCVCGDWADVVFMTKGPEGLHQSAYCSEHALEEVARATMMRDTAAMN